MLVMLERFCGLNAGPPRVGSIDPGGAEWLYAHHPEIFKFSKVLTYPKRGIIFREGIATDSVYVLLSGVAISYRTAAVGRQQLVCLLTPGRFYGFMTMFGAGVQTMTVEAVEPCRNLAIDKIQLKRLFMADHTLLWNFTEQISMGISNYAEIVETNFLTAEQRIYKALLILSEQFGHWVGQEVELRVHLTQELLATFAGTTRGTTARVLAGLIEQGIACVRPKPWRILRRDTLVQLTERPDEKSQRKSASSGR
jgi:CRP-like cAMP-binding protein